MSNKRPSRFQRKNGKVNNEHLAAESQPAIGKKADTVEALAAVPILKYNHLKKKVVQTVLLKVVHCTTFRLTQVVYHNSSTVYYF